MKLARNLTGVFTMALVLSLSVIALAAPPKVDVNSVPRVDPATDLDVSNSSHNLSNQSGSSFALNTDAAAGTGGTDEVCVYCHTPHFANPEAVDAPLWNRMNSGAVYTPYSSSTMDTTPGQPTGNSVACLSCHDGTVALDALVNAPGRGLGTSTTGVSNPSYTFPSGVVNATFTNNPAWSLMWTFHEGTNTLAVPATLAESGGRVLIGTDLSNDHPISMPYPTVAQDPGFNQPPGTPGSPRVFPNGIRTFAGDKVECGSCHEPHWGSTQASAKGIVNKLRVSNTQSAMCLTCHIK
jgi:hypothetical protein